jgi:aminopeptidase YwaD
MFQRTYDAVAAEASGAIALRYTSAISQYHRIQASPGYRAAAEWAVETLRAAGVSVEVETYPARFDAAAWSNDHWPEWSCAAARLRVVGPDGAAQRLDLLCDYDAVPLSIVQRSTATPAGGVTAPLVLVERGEELEGYDGIDVRGTIVLTGGDARRVHELAVERFGALGLITDKMATIPNLREPMDLPDARQYTSFWWSGQEPTRAWGFVLTPRQGRALRAALKDATEPITVHAEVVADFYDGTMENVVATIPGETDEEVLVVGHLCHPQPSANDNATGAAATMEIARALTALVRRGTIPKPKRTIRCLLCPEITGSFAYLAMHEDRIAKTVAAINLDMVGEDPAQTGSTYTIVRSPIQTEGFSGALASRLLKHIATHDRASFSGMGGFASFAYAVLPYSAGSDHYIYGDPTVGIPCPMIINEPDKFYHTSADTIENVSPAVLHRSATLAGTYAAFIANAGAPEAVWLANEMAADFRADAANRTSDALADALAGNVTNEQLDAAWGKLTSQLHFRQERQEANLRSLLRLSIEAGNALDWLSRDVEQVVRDEVRRACDACRAVAKETTGGTVVAPGPRTLTAEEQEAARIILRRTFKGPIGMRYFDRHLPAEAQEGLRKLMQAHRHGMTIAGSALFWFDGARTLLDVADLVELEEGIRDMTFLLGFAGYLEASDVVTRVPATTREAADD